MVGDVGQIDIKIKYANEQQDTYHQPNVLE
jgi:hypothetical protein